MNNKLKEVKESAGKSPTPSMDRRTQVVLTRLRIGHTRATHGHLMATPKDPAPVCDTCDEQITIKHIFNDCPKYNNARKQHLGTIKNIQVLNPSTNFPVPKIIKFLKEIKLYDEI